MSDSVGRVDLDLGLNYGAFNKELHSIAGTATNQVGGAFKKLGLIIASAFAVKELFDFGKGAIGLASDLNEVQNVVDVTFGSMSQQVNDFSKNALTSFGLSELSAKKYASTLGAMMKSSGLAGQTMTNLSTDLTGLSADFASFYNLSNDNAFDKIRAGLAGESEPLRQLGINMSVANLEAFALTQGIKKQFQAMSQAEQTLLRYNYLMSVSKDAQGDFARTSTGWANQTRLLTEQWKIFQGTMGQGFINILAPVLRGLNQLIVKLQVAAQYFKAFTELIMGIKPKAATTAKTVEDMGDATTGAGAATKKAGKAVKGSLSSFDMLNVIAQSTADSMGDIAGGAADIATDMPVVGGQPEIPKPDLTALTPLLNFFDEVKAKALGVRDFFVSEFGPTIQNALNTMKAPLQEWGTNFTTAFSFIRSLGDPFMEWFKTDFVDLMKNEITLLSNEWAGLLDTADKVFDGIMAAAEPIMTWLVVDGLPLMTSFAEGVVQIIQHAFDTVKHIFDTIWEDVMEPGLLIASGMIVDTLDIIKGFWDDFGDDIVGGLTDWIDNVSILFDSIWDSYLKPIWTEMLKNLSWLWEKHLKGLVEQVTILIGKLVTGWLEISNKFLMPIVNFLIKTLGPTFANVMSTVGHIVGTAFGVIADVAKGLIRSLGGIIDFIVGVFTGDWKKAWGGIKDVFGGITDAIVGVFKGMVNLIIDAVNFMIRQLNMVHVDVPDWVEKVTGMKGFGISIKEIPKLAKGGLAYGPTLAMIGDNKGAAGDPEVVSPLSKLQEIMGGVNQSMIDVLLMILDAIERQETTIEIDGQTLTRVIRDKLRLEGGRVGRNMITVGGVPLR